MPVIFNEPLSFLERIAEYMEYTSLVEQAAACDDPVERLEVRRQTEADRGRRGLTEMHLARNHLLPVLNCLF